MEKDTEKDHTISDLSLELCKALVNSSFQLKSSSGSSQVDSFMCCIAALNSFCLASPTLLVSEVDRLITHFPDLKAKNPYNEKVISYLASIFESTVPLVEFPQSDFIENLEKSLVSIIKSHGKNVISFSSLKITLTCFFLKK